MIGKMLPADVADAFIKQYYLILNKCPENVYKFYQEPSLLGWPGPDGVVKPVTTLSGINNMVMSSDYKYCSAEVKTTDAQDSLEGGIIVAVTGCFTRKDNVKKNFSQTFFLAKQERGFFVLNDILRFLDVYESIPNAAANDDEKDQSSPMQNSVPCNTSDSPTSLDAKAAVENGKGNKALDHSVSRDTLANGASSIPSVASSERVAVPATNAKEQSVAALATNAKEQSTAALATNAKAPSVIAPAKNAKLPSVVALATNAKVPSTIDAVATNAKVPFVVAPASNDVQKITYASMLAKETPVTSPRAAAVNSNVYRQIVASPATKTSASVGDGSPKVSIPSSGVLKAVTSSSKVTPKSPIAGQGAPNTIAYAETKGIYIGGLPYGITKQGIVDVVKQFGLVRRYSDTVQIRRHEDGFCCGFVEFESADAARRAVEAHHVIFGEKEAYITYKRSSYNRGNDGGARSPTRGGRRNGNSKGRENDDQTYYGNGQARGPRWSSPSDHWRRQAGRDRLK